MNTEKYPLVSVNILSFNRKDELRVTLTKIYEQDYKNIEVIVVDNASSDGTREMVKSEFPSVILIELEKNIGIAGWNKGFEIAKGEYVLVLDDDSYPEKDAINAGIETISKDEKIGIVAFEIYNTKFHFSETMNYPKNPLSFTGCGALINKNLLKEINFFNPAFFIYLHEIDFSFRTYNSGWQVIYDKNSKIIHNQSLNSRGNSQENPFASKYRFHFYFVNMSLFLFLYFDFESFLYNYFRWILNRLIITFRYLYFKEFFVGIYSSIIKIFLNINARKVGKKDIQNFYNRGKVFPIFDRDFFPFGKK